MRVIVSTGGLLAVFGVFSIIFVVAPPAVKLLIGMWLLYALVRLGWGFLRA